MRAAILLRDHWEWSVPSVPPPIFGPADERTYLPRLPLLTLPRNARALGSGPAPATLNAFKNANFTVKKPWAAGSRRPHSGLP